MPSHIHTDHCKEVFALLSDYLDLELPPDACREIEAHIAGCAPCIEFTDSLRKTVELCHKYEPSELPQAIGQHAREELLQAYQKALAARASGISPK